MRVKLSYTVEEESVLGETAKIISLCGDDMQQIINLFQGVQTELKGENEGTPTLRNTLKALEMIEEFRHALLNVDTRLAEVSSIIAGFEDHLKDRKREKEESLSVQEDLMGDMFGAD